MFNEVAFGNESKFWHNLPEIVINLRPTGAGACGGASRMTNGSGVTGLAGC